MLIKVNGKEIELSKGVNISEFLIEQKVEMPEYVTVQINEEIIPKEQFETTIISTGDSVEFLYFMGGGSI
ncbi:UNVERIFIED_CONTAM: sulfur carrier protein [Acetivibrio alkalicellulosi]